MRVIKADHRHPCACPKRDCLPPNLVRVARLDDVWLFALQHLTDRTQIQERAIPRRARNQWGPDCVSAAAFVPCPPRFFPRNDENVFVVPLLANVIRLLLHIPFHASAERRIELGQVANLQGIADFRLATADFRDAAIIATSSEASFNNGAICFSERMLVSTMSSNQNAVSSASSSTTPILAMNSARDLARHAAR